MLRSALKRNLFPIVLITVGCLIFLAIILYLFRAHLAMVGWVLFGFFLIGIGVIGIVASNPKNKTLAGTKPVQSAPASADAAPSPKRAPGYAAAKMRETRSAPQTTVTISKPLLIGGGVLVVSLVLVLLCNFGTALRSLLTVHQTQIVDCSEASRYARNGWEFVSAYSYRLGDEISGYTEHTECVMAREQFVWAKDERVPTDEVLIDEAFEDERAMGDIGNVTVVPTQSSIPVQTQIPQPSATPMPLPTSTIEVVSSPLPTWTPPPVSEPTATPLPPSPTPTPIPRTDVEVCEATSDNTYLDIYVQWEGTIVDDPTFEDAGLWFQVQWKNADPDSECDQGTFFVSYDRDERFFAEDMVIVTGTIVDTTYEYEGESGQTDYAVVIRADYVEFLDEP